MGFSCFGGGGAGSGDRISAMWLWWGVIRCHSGARYGSRPANALSSNLIE